MQSLKWPNGPRTIHSTSPAACASTPSVRSRLAGAAGEIANLTWPMLAEPTGEIGKSLALQDRASRRAAVESFQFTQISTRAWSSWHALLSYWTVR